MREAMAGVTDTHRSGIWTVYARLPGLVRREAPEVDAPYRRLCPDSAELNSTSSKIL
jgi:hypothetical protein